MRMAWMIRNAAGEMYTGEGWTSDVHEALKYDSQGGAAAGVNENGLKGAEIFELDLDA